MRALIASLALLGSVLAGCASLGLATPKGFDQQLAQAYGIHTAVVSATATALQTRSITSAEAEQVQKQADSARALLDTAHTAEASNPGAAQNDLSLALTALTALQTYLNNQGSK